MMILRPDEAGVSVDWQWGVMGVMRQPPLMMHHNMDILDGHKYGYGYGCGYGHSYGGYGYYGMSSDDDDISGSGVTGWVVAV